MGKTIRVTPTFLHLLLCLADQAKHGYHMMQEIEARTGGRLRLGPSSLYYALGRLEDAGLIEEVEGAAGGDEPHEERRRYYGLTEAGLGRLRVETEALADLVAHARAHGVLG
jgi:DNA-binding PadR family transcriptional regulator